MDGGIVTDPRAPVARVITGKAPEDLNGFADEDVAAAVWMRAPELGFQSWMDALDPAHLPTARIILRPGVAHDAVTMLCDSAGLPESPERAKLCGDIAALADIFSTLMGTDYLRLRLERVTDNACRKFHLDAVTGRLVCTYRGTGTQYGFATGDQDPSQIHTVPTGSPILMRGTLWPTRCANTLRHRSPPIAGTGETRLLLVLDPISDPEDEI
ncbi:MAG: DUF1826 domain-containing protein [Dinoroseobacter sp.]|nr:DUF1826 domain-containing protein [Dinoroseobacter sp.]